MTRPRYIFFWLMWLFNFAIVSGQSIPDQWLTTYEKSGFKKTPRYDETMEYCRRLESASPWIKIVSFGTSPEGRDLSLVIASKDGISDPKSALMSGKAILLVQNGIHAGEIDGKDACLMLLRDMVITKSKASLLDHVIFLVIPIFNVDGHERFGPYNRINQNGPDEMGWRVTAQNLNLNRDYMKADAPEMWAWLRMYNAWLPDFFIDAHVTDGADYQYTVTYDIEKGETAAQPVREWIINDYLPSLNQIRTDGIPVAPYIMFRDDTDPSKGLLGGSTPPRFSTAYVALHNRPGLLIETHMLKEYKKRVEGTYAVIETTLRVLNRDYKKLREKITQADSITSRTIALSNFPLQFERVDTPSQTVHFYGYRQTNEKSAVSGGIKMVYSKEPVEIDIPRYDSLRVTKSISPPVAYIIPRQWNEVIERLELHGVKLEKLKAPQRLYVELYKLTAPKWQQRPFEGRLGVTYNIEVTHDSMTYPAGTVVVRMNQPAAKVAIHLLEPAAPDAFVQWGFFNTIFEQKEYAEDYVLEPLASRMLSENQILRREFDQKLRDDTSFAHSPRARLQFFYQRSPYWDSQVNLYPVARLMSDEELNTESLQ
jgi:hypothetical protein